jgi:site-specific recombinase XerD
VSKPVKFIPYFHESLGVWSLNIPPFLSKTGRRARLYFRDKETAQRSAQRLKTRHRKFGVSLASLDPVRLGEASEAYKLLDAQNRPYSLMTIVRAWIAKEEQKNRSIPLYDLFSQFIEAHAHHSAPHTLQILSMQKRFKPLWEIPVSEIETEMLSEILDSLAGTTRNRYIRTLSALWNYAIKKEWTKENPVSKLDRVHHEKRATQTFSNQVVEGMLNEALKNNLAMVPYFALGAFAGLRVGSGELNRLRWDDIRFEEKTIIVRAEIAKTKQRRFIDISPNLEAWLKAYLAKKGEATNVAFAKKRVITLSPQLLRQARTEIFHKVAGKNAKYIQAGLRHTFASNHLAQHGSIDSLVMQLGHRGSAKTLWTHYHLHTRKEDAQAFWGIYPPSE